MIVDQLSIVLNSRVHKMNQFNEGWQLPEKGDLLNVHYIDSQEQDNCIFGICLAKPTFAIAFDTYTFHIILADGNYHTILSTACYVIQQGKNI